MATTSERLKEIISIRNIKQVEIIERTGINKGTLSSYISGRYIPKQDNIYKLAKVLSVNPAWLMGLDVPMDPPAAPVPDSPAAGSSSIHLRRDESELLDKYNMLNDLGRNKAYEYVSDLTENEKYIQGLEESNKVS